MKSINLSLALYAAIQATNAYELDRADLDSLTRNPIHSTANFAHPHEDPISTPEDLSKYPNITLDHGIHLPTIQNTDAGYVTYKNIQYGRNPTGDLRFALPVAPAKVDKDLPVFNGSAGRSCYQANTLWATKSVQDAGRPDFNWEEAFQTETDGDDCLYLDISTPLEVVAGEKYPVLVWIYGGGFVYGKKDTDLYSPAGFYRRATGNNKFLYVAINYRVCYFPSFVSTSWFLDVQ